MTARPGRRPNAWRRGRPGRSASWARSPPRISRAAPSTPTDHGIRFGDITRERDLEGRTADPGLITVAVRRHHAGVRAVRPGWRGRAPTWETAAAPSAAPAPRAASGSAPADQAASRPAAKASPAPVGSIIGTAMPADDRTTWSGPHQTAPAAPRL